MWLEVKAVISIISIFIIAIICALSGNLIFVFLALMSIFTMLFGDIILGWKIVSTDAIHKLDPIGLDEKIIELHLNGGGVKLFKAKKGPLGKLLFTWKKQKASIIDDGSYTLSYPNGNQAVIGHESYDKNINFYEAELLKRLFKDNNVDNVKDLYEVLKAKETNMPGVKHGT